MYSNVDIDEVEPTYVIDCVYLLRHDDPANADGIIVYELVKDCGLRRFAYT